MLLIIRLTSKTGAAVMAAPADIFRIILYSTLFFYSSFANSQ